MLKKFATRREPDGTLVIGPETEDVPCAWCGGESNVEICPSDGRVHHHGQIHRPGGALDACCDNCIETARQEWAARRTQ